MHPLVMRIQVYSNEEPFPRRDNYEIAKILDKIQRSSPESLDQFQPKLVQTILGRGEFKFDHMSNHPNKGEMCADYSPEVSRCFNNPWHLQELDSVVSVCRRRLEKTIKSTGEPISLTDYIVHTVEFMNETFFKAATLRTLKYHISMEKALLELGEGLIFKVIAVLHANLIDIIPGLYDNEVKMFLLEMEGYFLKVGQKVHNMDLNHVIKRIVEDNDTFLKVKELLKERMNTFEKTMNKLYEKEFPDQVKDIFHLVMDVLSIFNQAEDPTECQQAAEKE